MPPAWPIDLVNGDQISGGGAGTLPAVAGYPHLTVPMGLVKGLPVGLSFIGPKWSDAMILSLGYAYEQASHRTGRAGAVAVDRGNTGRRPPLPAGAALGGEPQRLEIEARLDLAIDEFAGRGGGQQRLIAAERHA